ncbi:aminotransferase class I/II-fold pyridoxal phosphate-dependent enzyme [Ornithinimicrobium avium]|uniref:Aminotransferase class I/II-fold pyridoxal phosphate-dependent enzyme n=1 Tax=Ornithinimicrobium avium TaxID=2283195 RepID=A0A345NNS0_9MICO|nr:aminotransferase class I/II-fold pyridoxal phosphate-dependent enzyme [Ornithinimicrobium avium]AXH96678.1 aminotransferase class I/II-fold pyridoxal phosphate-dependent enzyme [Ornithinimicrobium avium]
MVQDDTQQGRAARLSSLASSGAAPVVPPAGAHGGDGLAVAAALGLDPADLLDLSQNMNPVAPPVAPLVERHADALYRYPDPAPATIELARALGVEAERLLLTNGGSEAIHLVTQVLGGGVRSEPEFSLHPRGTEGARWRTDPHSPTGVLAGPGETADVWDEAFYALATGLWTAGREEVTVVGSLTKTFNCPGLRIGYVLADPEVVRGCARRQAHWSVSTLALAVLPDLLGTADLPTWTDAVARLRDDLVGLLRGHGLTATAADAPWVLVREPRLRERLAPHGVLVRDCRSFGLPGTFRIAVPGPPGFERLEAALARL